LPLMKLSAWALLTLSLSLAGAPSRIDHVTVCGPELGPMQARLEKLGLHVEYGGPHANHVTEMAVASFPDGSYLELIAFQRHADPIAAEKHYWAKYMRDNAGPCAWAVRSDDVAAETARLRAAGVEVSEPNKSGRTRPDGYRLDWETATVGNQAQGTFFPFLIRDITPRDKRAFPSGKPGNPDFAGVTKVRIGVSNIDEASARFQKAYGPLTGTPIGLVAETSSREGVEGFGIQRAGSTEILWIEPPR
jgi:hypothetical protein